MPHPEGYRKAIRVMKLAQKYGCPIITFIDTPGAYPGIGAEERGQSQAIAESLYVMGFVEVPTVSVVIGEGGSGGALALGVADRVYIMENAYYSVISPEGCAAILWKDQSKVEEAAKALKITAPELLKLGVVDGVIPEPLGAAHWSLERSARILKCFLRKALKELEVFSPEQLIENRLKKFGSMGVFVEA
jgi:acetyl-CoA carboxylase carboxyl transferase subunit alpha